MISNHKPKQLCEVKCSSPRVNPIDLGTSTPSRSKANSCFSFLMLTSTLMSSADPYDLLVKVGREVNLNERTNYWGRHYGPSRIRCFFGGKSQRADAHTKVSLHKRGEGRAWLGLPDRRLKDMCVVPDCAFFTFSAGDLLLILFQARLSTRRYSHSNAHKVNQTSTSL